MVNSPMANILLVEDDEDLATLTQDYLANYGYNINVEGNGATAIERILEEKPDLVILDLMLPGADGIEVCRSIRDKFHNPILMLTARTDQIDQILGLEIGADDYVCKPVEPRLLAARVKALLRRSQPETSPAEILTNSEALTFDDLVIDNGSRRVTLADKEVELTTPEYDLLWLLAQNAGTVLSRQEIFESLRGISYDGQNRAIDINISHIRSKLNDDPNSPQRIKTVRNKGYMFAKSIRS
ncbi:response regulator transcription factor BfmR [Maricurvus nonylphenolicus]|uniref:response regulator n=1 Tax=Maricurvus nonylphenolicus TaxID=1008307 RepID=UPI0036F41D30